MLVIHVIFGTIALLTGLVIIIFRKGTRFHKKTGRIYFWAMTSVAITAFFMSIIHNSAFLFMLAFFSFYLVYTGYWAHRQNERARRGDWIVLAAVFMAGAYRFYLTLIHPWYNDAIIPLIFSIGCIATTVQDAIAYLRKRMLNTYNMRRHITRMLGSYIAAVTAFVVVNVHDFQPAWIPWFAPSVVGSVLISILVKKYTKRRSTSQL